MHDFANEPTGDVAREPHTQERASRENDVIPEKPALPTSLWRMPAMRLVAIYTLFGFTGMFATVSALPAYLADHGTPEALVGLVSPALLVMTVATQTLVPRFVRTFGMTTVLIAGSVLLGGPSLLFLVTTNYGWVLPIMAVRGIGFGILTVLGSLLAGRIVPPSRHGESIGIYGLAIAIPNVIVVAGAVALVAAGHFVVVALLGAVPLLGILSARSLGRAAGTEDDSESADLDRNPASRAAVKTERRTARVAATRPAFVLMVVTLTSGGFMTYLPIARPEGALATVGLLVWGSAAALSRWRVGLLADKTGLRRLLPSSSVLSIIGIGVVAIGLVLTGAGSWAVLLVGAAILGVGFGATQNLTLIAAFAQARQKQAATVSSIWNMGFDTGTGLGSAVVGGIAALIAIPGAMAVTAVLIVVSMPWAVRSAKPVGPG